MAILTNAWQKGGPGATALSGLGNIPQGLCVAKHNIDINKILNGTNNIPATAIATGSQIPLMQLPANMALVGLQAIVTTAFDASTSTLSIGDGASGTRYVSGASTLTAGTVLTQAVTTNPLRFYATADQLLLTLNGTYTTASVGALRFVAVFYDASADPISTTQA